MAMYGSWICKYVAAKVNVGEQEYLEQVFCPRKNSTQCGQDASNSSPEPMAACSW